MTGLANDMQINPSQDLSFSVSANTRDAIMTTENMVESVNGIMAGLANDIQISPPQDLSFSVSADTSDAIQATKSMAETINSIMAGLVETIQVRSPQYFSISADAANTVSGNGYSGDTFNYGSLVNVQQMIVHGEDDIRKVSQELYNLIQTGSRAQGRFVTA